MPTPITSPSNPQLKELRRLHRRRSRERGGRFVAEGEDLLAVAERAGWPALERYVAAGSGLAGTEVAPEALARASTLGSGTRAIGVYEERFAEPAGPLCVYLHGVGDPGNVGAVLRSALMLGASSVALGPDCADPFGPRAVRASMGAIFAMPVARAEPDDLPGTTIALVPGTGEPLTGPRDGDVSVLIGAERDGLPDDVVAGCDEVAHIEQVGEGVAAGVESLNAAMAATIAVYELGTRHRMAAG
jgi:TrmH family RNA methyltransferase